MKRDPEAAWIFVADNLTTHCSATLVLLIAGLCAVLTESLGSSIQPTSRNFLGMVLFAAITLWIK